MTRCARSINLIQHSIQLNLFSIWGGGGFTGHHLKLKQRYEMDKEINLFYCIQFSNEKKNIVCGERVKWEIKLEKKSDVSRSWPAWFMYICKHHLRASLSYSRVTELQNLGIKFFFFFNRTYMANGQRGKIHIIFDCLCELCVFLFEDREERKKAKARSSCRPRLPTQ